MEEITKAIEKIKELSTDDPNLLKGLGELQGLLNEANKKDDEMANKHRALINDYRDLIANAPASAKHLTQQEDTPNPPPVEKRLPTFDEALAKVLADKEKH